MAQGPRSHHLARPGRHRSRTRAGVRHRGRDGDEGLPRIRTRGIEALLHAGAERPGGVQEDRLRAVRGVARPRAPVHERRTGLPGVPQRGRGRTLEPRKGLRRCARRGESQGHRSRVLTRTTSFRSITMKLIRFSQGDSKPRFGVVINDRAIAFASLQQRCGITQPDLSDSEAYLAGLPESERVAREIAGWGEMHLAKFPESERPMLKQVRLHEPIEVAALFDFGLTPRHLKNSGQVIMKYEKDNPQTSAMLQAFAKAVLAPKPKPPAGQPEALSYYKSNMNTIVGDAVIVPWPVYT